MLVHMFVSITTRFIWIKSLLYQWSMALDVIKKRFNHGAYDNVHDQLTYHR